MNAASFARLCWEAMGKEKPIGLESDCLNSDAPCFLCGLPCKVVGAVPTKKAIAITFNGKQLARSLSSSAVCIPCAWSLKARVEDRKKEGLSPGGKEKRAPWLRCFTALAWIENGNPKITVLDKSQKGQMRAFLTNPPSSQWGAAISDSGQKQIIWRTPLNSPKTARIRFEEILIDYRPSQLKSLIFNITELLNLGFAKSEVETGGYASKKIMTVGVDEWHQREMKITEQRHGALFSLALWLSQRSEDASKAIRDAHSPDRGVAKSTPEDVRPAQNVGENPLSGDGRSCERGELGKVRREHDEEVADRPSAAAVKASGDQMHFGW